MNFTLCKNRCNYTKRNKQSRNPTLSVQPSQNRTIPRPAPPHLPPLSKGGGLTARHKLLLCCVLIATHLPFLFTKLFCRQDGGIATPLLPKPHYTSKSTISLPPLSKVRCCRPKEFGRLPEGLPHHHPLLSAPTRSTILKPDTRGQKGKVYNKRSPTACFDNGDSVLYICFTLSIYPHRQQAQRFRVRDYPSSQAYIRRPKFRLFRRCRQASAYSCYRLSCRLRSACRYLYGR